MGRTLPKPEIAGLVEMRYVAVTGSFEAIMTKATQHDRTSQSDKVKKAARELGADEDETRSDERLRKVMKQEGTPDEGKAAGTGGVAVAGDETAKAADTSGTDPILPKRS
jgi:hypothetical protein